MGLTPEQEKLGLEKALRVHQNILGIVLNTSFKGDDCATVTEILDYCTTVIGQLESKNKQQKLDEESPSEQNEKTDF